MNYRPSVRLKCALSNAAFDNVDFCFSHADKKRLVRLIEFERSFYPELSCPSVFVHPQFVWLKHQRKVHGGKEDSYLLLTCSFNNCFLGACWSSYHMTGTLSHLILRVSLLWIASIWPFDESLYHTLLTWQARWISRGDETALCKLDAQCKVGLTNQRVGRFMWARYLVSSRHLSRGNFWQATMRRLFLCHVLNGTYSLHNTTFRKEIPNCSTQAPVPVLKWE